MQDQLLLRDYHTRLADLERDRSQLTATMKPEHYKVQKVEAQIGDLKGLMTKEMNNIIGRIKNDYQAAQKREALLIKAYDQQFKAVSEQSERSIPINVLKREVDSNRQFYQDMLQKVNSAGVATAIRASNIRIVDAAREPLLPYKPDLVVNAWGSGVCQPAHWNHAVFFREAKAPSQSKAVEAGRVFTPSQNARTGCDPHGQVRRPEHDRPADANDGAAEEQSAGRMGIAAADLERLVPRYFSSLPLDDHRRSPRHRSSRLPRSAAGR